MSGRGDSNREADMSRLDCCIAPPAPGLGRGEGARSTRRRAGAPLGPWSRVGALLLAVALGGAACGGDDTHLADTGERDTSLADTGDGVAANDTLVPIDTTLPPTDTGDTSGPPPPACETNPGAPLCPCTANADCNSGFCVPSSEGGEICTTFCDDACPGDMVCRLVYFPSQDPVFLCVDTLANTCRPCRQNLDCQGNFGRADDRCVPFGEREGSFCGSACGGDTDCLEGFSCEQVADVELGVVSGQCVPISGECACSGRAIREQAATTCRDGLCEGSRICTDDGLTACDARTPEPEVCDGVDNNCNGLTDEGFPDTDGDGVADCVDPDIDGDGVLNEDDNCPLVWNPQQEDTNGNGVGDACDTPAVPTVLASAPPSPANENAPTLSGAGEEGSVVRLYASEGCLGASRGEALVDDAGAWAVGVTVADDTTTTFWADAAFPTSGLRSACSPEGLTYVEDSSPPLAPNLLGTDPPSPGSTTDFLVLGFAEPLATVTLYEDAACATPTGEWSTAEADGSVAVPSAAPPQGMVTRRARATDRAGNTSGCSAPVTYRHDDIPPPAPTLTHTIPPSPSGAVTEPLIGGHTEGGAVVTLFATPDCSGPALATVTAASNGLFTVGVTVAASSTTTFFAHATDAAGNTSPCSAPGLTYVHYDADAAAPVLLATAPPSPSNVPSPIVTGTAEPGSTVRLYLGAGCAGFFLGEGVADAHGAFAIEVLVPTNALTLISGLAINVVGSTSPCAAEPLSYIHDSVPPAAPTFTGTAPPSPSPDPAPRVLGAAEPLSTVTLYRDDACSDPTGASTVTHPAGDFAVDVDVALNAETTWWARATDAAGNTSLCSDLPATYVHDDVAPPAPTLLATSPPSPSAATTPSVLGAAEPGALVAIHDDAGCAGMPLGEAHADAEGDFDVVITVGEDTATPLYGSATDAAGNVSPCSSEPLLYVNDTAEPLVPVLTHTTPASPSRTSTTPVFHGEAEAGNTVELHRTPDCSDDAPSIGPVGVDGRFAIQVTVAPNAATTMWAISVDGGGRRSPCSPQGLTFVHDDIPPPTPTLTSTTPSSPSNTVTSPIVRGTSALGTTVEIYTAPGCAIGWVATVSTDAAGQIAVSITVPQNLTTSFYAAARDAAGNVSPCTTTPLTYTHDNTPPAPPVLSATEPPSPAASDTPTVIGTAEAGSFVTLYTDPDCLGTIAGQGQTSSGGGFSLTAQVGQNVTTAIRATARDLAGNVSACSAPLIYVNDVEPPPRPFWVSSVPPSPSNAVLDPTLHGWTEAGSAVQLFVGDACVGGVAATTTADVDGTFSFAVSVAPNTATAFYANALDAVGNTSACSDPPLVYVHNTIGPPPPVILGTNPTSPGQSLTPAVQGTADGNATVRLYLGSACAGDPIGQAAAGSTGGWQATGVGPVNANAPSALTATATDPAGNTSPCSVPFTYVHDNIPPEAPIVVDTLPAGPSNVLQPQVRGTAEPGATVRIYPNSTCSGSARGSGSANASGNFSVTATANTNSATTFHARATDAAGNVGPCSSTSVTYLHDSIPPDRPVMLATDPSPWSRTVSAPLVSGTAEPGATVRIFGAANCTTLLATATASATGAFSVAVELGPGNRQVAFAATAVDAAGNVSLCSLNALFYRFDDTPPLFAGAAAVGSGSDTTSTMAVVWSPATDNFTQASNMVYEVCLSTRCGAPDCDFDDPAASHITTTAPGATSITLGGLSPNTRYYVVVRARDEVGNREANHRVMSLKTEGLNSVVDLVVGENATCASLSDGGRRCWGPGNVPANLTDPVHLAIGSSHGCAVERGGQVRCWGDNSYGQLGNNTTTPSETAVNVANLGDAVKVGVGNQHTCALSITGRTWCWGRDEQGQLGNGFANLSNRLMPTEVTVDLMGDVPLTGAVDLAVGWNHACVIRDEGATWCWGSNGSGQLGTGNNQGFAYAVPSGAADLIRVVAGQFHTCGLTSAGTVSCWGWNAWGQIGNGDVPWDAVSPVDVGLTGVVGLDTSSLHTCAVRADGTAACWGRNLDGQIGMGSTTANVDSPANVVGLDRVVGIGAGDGFTCARRADGTARCWGSGEGGRLGQAGSNASSLTPVLVDVPLGISAVTSVSLRAAHACVVLSDGTARCWGDDREGQLGTGASGDPAATLAIVSGLDGATAISAGADHTCATGVMGPVCWGGNGLGQLGAAGPGASAPQPAGDLPRVRAMAQGAGFGCAVTVGGEVWCWGDNGQGQLGLGAVGGVGAPAPVPGVAAARQVAAGEAHACAVTTAGEVWCWGADGEGQVTGTPGDPKATPVAVPGLVGARRVAAGGGHTCAVHDGGHLACWGANGDGQIGHGTLGGSLGVTSVPTVAGAVDVAAGDRHTCALLHTGALLCWGDNRDGAVGVGAQAAALATPATVSTLHAVTGVAAGRSNTCARTRYGLTWCWGSDAHGALGGDAPESGARLSPAPVECLP